jgi:hypothetical protein
MKWSIFLSRHQIEQCHFDFKSLPLGGCTIQPSIAGHRQSLQRSRILGCPEKANSWSKLPGHGDSSRPVAHARSIVTNLRLRSCKANIESTSGRAERIQSLECCNRSLRRRTINLPRCQRFSCRGKTRRCFSVGRLALTGDRRRPISFWERSPAFHWTISRFIDTELGTRLRLIESHRRWVSSLAFSKVSDQMESVPLFLRAH